MADTVQTSAGIVIQDILVATVAAERQGRIIVQHTELVAAAAQVLMDKVITVLAAVHTTDTVPVLVDSLVQTALAAYPVSHGVTAKVTATTVAEIMVAVVVVVAHHTAEAGAAKALFVSFGHLQDNTLITQVKEF